MESNQADIMNNKGTYFMKLIKWECMDVQTLKFIGK